MTQATADTLVNMALAKYPGLRNKAGHFLAQQLHWNGYSEPDAEAVMLQYANSVGGTGKDAYTTKEARTTLKAEYRRPIEGHDPWSGSQGCRW